jgi:hypothetical protein
MINPYKITVGRRPNANTYIPFFNSYVPKWNETINMLLIDKG